MENFFDLKVLIFVSFITNPYLTYDTSRLY